MLSIDAVYLLYVSTGFAVGFGHCIGMCGPIAVSLSLNLKGRSVTVPHLLYNSGRILTYALMGGVMGATGSFTIVTSNLVGIQKGVMVIAGMMIVIMGLAMSGWIPLGRIFGDTYNPNGLVARGYRKLTGVKNTAAYFPLGLLLGLLPCGPVYTALIGAARAGMESMDILNGIINGAGLMFAFGLGTIPAMFLIGRLAGVGWLKSKHRLYQVGSILMIAVGVYFIIKALRF